MRTDIVLIGPPRVGKSTVGALLAQRLGCTHHELDTLRRGYYEEIGFDMDLNLRLFESQGWAGMYQYWKVFDPHAIERFFADCRGVLDLGGGTPVAEHPAVFARVRQAFAPFAHVVLLLPDPDLERSLAVLGRRTPDDSDQTQAQRYFLEQGSLQELATHTVYTGERSAEAVSAAILEFVRGPLRN